MMAVIQPDSRDWLRSAFSCRTANDRQWPRATDCEEDPLQGIMPLDSLVSVTEVPSFNSAQQSSAERPRPAMP